MHLDSPAGHDVRAQGGVPAELARRAAAAATGSPRPVPRRRVRRWVAARAGCRRRARVRPPASPWSLTLGCNALNRLAAPDQDVDAQDQGPEGQDEVHPGVDGGTDQKDDARDEAVDDQPPGQDPDAHADGGRREDEDGSHPQRVVVDQGERDQALQVPDGGIECSCDCRVGDQSSEHGGTDRHHGEEQQAAAQEDGCEEPVLVVADPVADHSHEPQEGDRGERQEAQGERHRIPALGIGQPGIGGGVVGGDGEADQHEHRTEQQREDHPRNAGRSWRA